MATGDPMVPWYEYNREIREEQMNAAAPIPSGLHFGLSYAEYSQMPGITASQLKAFRKSPKHYRHSLVFRKETRALSLGRSAHCSVLEPARFMREYTAWTRKTANGSSWPRKGPHWDAFVAKNGGKEIISESEYEAALAIGLAVRNDPVACQYLEEGAPEVSVCAQVDGTDMRARLDWLTGEGVIIELKTAADITPLAFCNAAARMGYYIQTAIYHDVLAAAGEDVRGVKVIVVESGPPHDVTVFDVPPVVIAQGRQEYRELVEKLAECQRCGYWPGVAGGIELDLELPAWVYGGESGLEGLNLEWSDDSGTES